MTIITSLDDGADAHFFISSLRKYLLSNCIVLGAWNRVLSFQFKLRNIYKIQFVGPGGFWGSYIYAEDCGIKDSHVRGGIWEEHFRLREGPEEGGRGKPVTFENLEEKQRGKLQAKEKQKKAGFNGADYMDKGSKLYPKTMGRH